MSGPSSLTNFRLRVGLGACGNYNGPNDFIVALNTPVSTSLYYRFLLSLPDFGVL